MISLLKWLKNNPSFTFYYNDSKNKVDYIYKLLSCILLTPLFVACSHPIIGQGHVKLLDRSCKPIVDKRVKVNNIQSSVYFRSGHLTKDVYMTDQQGHFEFDIEKNANKLTIFLPDAKEKEKSRWNWYTTTSNNDEILFFFDAGRSNLNTNFKTELKKSSVEKPIVIVYPYQKDTCNNDNPKLDNYNIPKIEENRIAEIEAAEKARIDSIKVVVPKYEIANFGLMKFSIENGRGVTRIDETNNFIKKEQQKLGTIFGVFFTMSEAAVLHYSSDITYTITYPKPGLTNPKTGITKKSRSMGYWEKHRDPPDFEDNLFDMSVMFRNQWQIKSGEWLFQIKNKDSVLLEQRFTVE